MQLDVDESAVINALERGAKTTDELCWCLRGNVKDRARMVRRVVASLLEKGFYIVNLQDGKGYELTTNIDKMRVFYFQEWGRIFRRTRAIEKIRDFLQANGGINGDDIINKKEI